MDVSVVMQGHNHNPIKNVKLPDVVCESKKHMFPNATNTYQFPHWENQDMSGNSGHTEA